MKHGFDHVHSPAGDTVIAVDDQNAAHHRYAKERDESDRGRNAEVQTRDVESQDTATNRERDSHKRHDAVAKGIKQTVQQDQDQDKADRHDDREPFLSLLQPFELSGPLDLISSRQAHVFRDPLLRVLDRACEIAPAHAELDRNEALVALTKNIGRAGIERNRSEIAQWNIGIAVGTLNANLDVVHRLKAAAVFRCQPHSDIELAVRLKQRGCDCAAQGRLHNGIDIADAQPITRRLFPIDFDVQIGLSQDPKDAEIGNTEYLAQFGCCLLRNAFQNREITADNLHGVGTFDARDAFLDIVLDILRKIEVDAGELVGEFLLQVLDEVCLDSAASPLLEWLQRHKELGIKEPCRVAAIVRTAMLRHNRDHFGMAQQYLSDPVDHRHPGFQRNGGRHGGPDPKIAFFERRQKLAAKPRANQSAACYEDQSDGDGGSPVRKRPAQHRCVNRTQHPHHNGLDLADMLRQQE